MIPGDVYRGGADSLQAQLQHQQAQAARAQRHVQRLRRVLRVRLLRGLVALPLSLLLGVGVGNGCGRAMSAVLLPLLGVADVGHTPDAVPVPSLASDPACQCVQRDPSGWWRWHCSEPACTVTQPIDVWGVPPAPRHGDGPPPAEGTTYDGGRTRVRYYAPITAATTGTAIAIGASQVTSGTLPMARGGTNSAGSWYEPPRSSAVMGGGVRP